MKYSIKLENFLNFSKVFRDSTTNFHEADWIPRFHVNFLKRRVAFGLVFKFLEDHANVMTSKDKQ